MTVNYRLDDKQNSKIKKVTRKTFSCSAQIAERRAKIHRAKNTQRPIKCFFFQSSQLERKMEATEKTKVYEKMRKLGHYQKERGLETQF